MGWDEVLGIAGELAGEPLTQVGEALRAGTVRCTGDRSGRSVIVKRARQIEDRPFDPDDPRLAGPFLGDVAGLRFLGPLGPGLIGAAPQVGVLVMHDLGVAEGLDPVLLRGTADAARRGLGDWAEALGNLHAACAGRRTEYEALRSSLGPAIPASDLVPKLIATLTALGIPAPEDELAAALAYGMASDFDTYLHRDPCPDNVLLLPDGLRIIDFERGSFGPATLDGSVLRMAMPTCWCVGRVPDDVLAEAEGRYRAAASRGIPELADEGRFAAGMAAACAAHLVVTLGWHLERALAEDVTWGEATFRERILTRLEVFRTVEGWTGLHAAGEALEGLLRERWGDVGLRLYPAFR